MLLTSLFAAIAAIPAAIAQESSATSATSYFAYPIFAPGGILGTAISAAPTGQPANFTATPIAGNATNVTTIYYSAYTTDADRLPYHTASMMQNVTSTSTSASTTMSCATSMGFERRSSVPTSYGFTTTTSTTSVTSTTCSTVTITPTASTFTGVVTSTLMVTTTIYSGQVPTTMPTPAGFIPLFAFAPAAPTANSRVKRYELEARDAMEALSILKRQTPAGNTGGIRVNRNGTTSNIYRRYPQQLDCSVQITLTKTFFVVEQGPVETAYAEVDAATSINTVTVSSTTTLTSEVPRETVWAACQGNNVVNSVEGTTGDPLIFDRVIYRPMEGFPLENELIVPVDNATMCCIECQKTPYCAGSIFAPSEGQCHIRLTQAPAPIPTLPGTNSTTNSTSPFLLPNSTSALSPTGTSPSTPLSTAAPNTCTGSRGFYLGTVQGQTDFPLEYALWMSNGPCGRLSVWPVPVNSTLDTSLSGPPVRVRRGLGVGM